MLACWHVRGWTEQGDFWPCVQIPLEVCEQRDAKGLYALARAGKIKGFTGVDDPYEPPDGPEITLEASQSRAMPSWWRCMS